MKAQKLILTILLATIVSAKPRSAHQNSVHKFETRQSTLEVINYSAYARKYAKIRATTRRIARKIQREKLNAVKKRQANNFVGMDLEESRRQQNSKEATLKKSEKSVVEPKTLAVIDKFRKDRNEYRMRYRKDITTLNYDGSKSHGRRSV